MVDIGRILDEATTIAVVGLSDKPERASHRVAAYMQGAGYRIFPVNPLLTGPVLGEQSYPDLGSVPGQVDIVNIFRRPQEVASTVEQAIDIGAEDFDLDGSFLEIRCAPEKFEELRRGIEEQGITLTSAEVTMVCKTQTSLSEHCAEMTLRLVDRLEELDDVQRVFTNADFPTEALERYRTSA